MKEHLCDFPCLEAWEGREGRRGEEVTRWVLDIPTQWLDKELPPRGLRLPVSDQQKRFLQMEKCLKP